jgi:hypothetical protein
LRSHFALRPSAPVCLPVAGVYRLRPELGMVASALPGLVNAGLESRNDTS